MGLNSHTDKKIVINSFFTVDKKIQAELSKSSGIFENIPDTFLVVPNILISSNKRDFTVNYLGAGIFETEESITEDETVFYLNTFAENVENVSASDTIPDIIEELNYTINNNFYIESDGSPWADFNISIENNLNKKEFFEIIVSRIYIIDEGDTIVIGCSFRTNDPVVTSENYYPDIYTNDFPPYILFSDKQMKTDLHHLQIIYNPGIIAYNSSGEKFIPEHSIIVSYKKISEKYYKYKTSYSEQIQKRKGDIIYGGYSPVNVYTNIENGYGIFAAYTERLDTIFIERKYLQK